MGNVRIYEAMADAFVAEGVDTLYTLVGTGNMHWVTAMQSGRGVDVYHTRHEHSACAMAMGYHSATGKVGVASVTCGPGFTHIMTALTAAVQNRVPLLVFAAETPISAGWHEQYVDQRALALACGARYIAVHSPKLVYYHIREAFHTARLERCPVVLGVPHDLQNEFIDASQDYVPSSSITPDTAPIPPDPHQVDEVVKALLAAKCPIILAGRGVLRASAQQQVEALADASGALLATTLVARGMFDHHPYSIGVSGGFARNIAREMGRQADLVVAFGASLTGYTRDGGKMHPHAQVIQIDLEPVGLRHGQSAADMYVRADAKLTASEILLRLRGAGPNNSQVRTEELARRIRDEPADNAPYAVEEGTLDPRSVFAKLETTIPSDYDMVSGTGHQAYFHTAMRGGDPDRYHIMRAFGAVGSALAYAMGVATCRRNGRVVLFEGDGGLSMFLQEFETMRRHGIKLLVVCCNDGAYGSEIHKLRAEKLTDEVAVFGRPDLESIANGFSLRGATITSIDQFERLMEEYERSDVAAIWNVHISDQVVNPHMRAEMEKYAKKTVPS